LPECRAAGIGPKALMPFGLLSLIAEFGYDAVASSGCDVRCILVSPPLPPPPHLATNAQHRHTTAPRPSSHLTRCNPRSPAPRWQRIRDAA
jgi:hypothetical protein